jgi:long-chain acyl-CoA synthetase
MERNLASILTATATRHGARPALKLDELVVSYELLDEASARVAGLLHARGVRPGDAIGLMLPNVPYFPIVYYGVLRAGGVVVAIHALLNGRELAHCLSDSDARLLFAWDGFADAARAGAERAGSELVTVAVGEFEQLLAAAEPAHELAAVAGDETAVVLYTSGTTGTPKGAQLTHDNLRRNAEICSETLVDATERDVVLGALPLFHGFGQTCALNAATCRGACLTLLPRFEPGKALEALERDRVTVVLGVPTMYAALLNHPDRERFDTSSLRVCLSAGAPLPAELMRAFERAFACPILEGYGMSETSPAASFNHPERARKPGSIGTPIEGVEMKIVDDDDREVPDGEIGEIVIRGHNIMKGYLNRPHATAEALRNGWFHTGDMAQRDADGYFFIVDRKTDVILRGSQRVYPREIEEVLYQHPAVLEATVVAIPDPVLGKDIGAAVVLRQGHTASADELRAHVKRELTGDNYPRQLWFVDELPKGPTGKVLKRTIEPPANHSAP